MKSVAFVAILITISLAGCPVWQCSSEPMKGACWYIKKHQEQQNQQSSDTQETVQQNSTTTVNSNAINAQAQVQDEVPDETETASQITSRALLDLDERDQVHVGPWCSATTQCFISDWSLNPYQKDCVEGQVQSTFEESTHISQHLSQKYCKDIDYKKAFNCEKYCIVHYESKDIYTFKFKDCNITMLQNDRPEHNPLRNTDWAGCRLDGDCSSNLCECVPNQNGQGKCTVSVYDQFYNQAFQTICDETRASDEFLHDMEEDSCALWILLKLGHHIKAVRDHAQVLPCLTKFADFTNLDSLKDQLGEKFQGKYILLPVGAGIIIVLIIYCYCKNRSKDEDDEDDKDMPLLSTEAAKE